MNNADLPLATVPQSADAICDRMSARLQLLLLAAPYAGSFALFTPRSTPLRMQPRPAAVAAPQMLALPSFGGGGQKGYDGPSEEVCWPASTAHRCSNAQLQGRPCDGSGPYC